MPAIITSPAAKAKPPPKEAPSNLRPGFLVGTGAAVDAIDTGAVIGTVFIVPSVIGFVVPPVIGFVVSLFVVWFLVPVVMAALLVGWFVSLEVTLLLTCTVDTSAKEKHLYVCYFNLTDITKAFNSKIQ